MRIRGHAGPMVSISCGYLALLKQYSLTLSINYSVTQPCPYDTPINSVHPKCMLTVIIVY